MSVQMKRNHFLAATAGSIAFGVPMLAEAAAAPAKRATTSGWREPSWYCSSAVVWLNVESGVYYHKGDRMYGRTERGAYVCEEQAIRAGNCASRASSALS
jgi:hypothetical protein